MQMVIEAHRKVKTKGKASGVDEVCLVLKLVYRESKLKAGL